MTKDEKIEKLRQIINRLIYSNWHLLEDADIGRLEYSPFVLSIEFKPTDKLSELRKKFKKKICEIEGIEEI
jgi:hypothetical protein